MDTPATGGKDAGTPSPATRMNTPATGANDPAGGPAPATRMNTPAIGGKDPASAVNPYAPPAPLISKELDDFRDRLLKR